MVTVYQGREVGVYSDPRDGLEDEDEDEDFEAEDEQENGHQRSI